MQTAVITVISRIQVIGAPADMEVPPSKTLAVWHRPSKRHQCILSMALLFSITIMGAGHILMLNGMEVKMTINNTQATRKMNSMQRYQAHQKGTKSASKKILMLNLSQRSTSWLHRLLMKRKQ